VTRQIPLIAATGYSHVAQLEHARQCGFDSIVVKPCEPAALVAEIDRLLGRERVPLEQTQPSSVEHRRQNR
jgi:CheY-like chemotaxis protein